MGKSDSGSSLGQVGPLQRLEIVGGKENLADERAGEECVSALESFQNKIRTGVFGTCEFIFSDSDDRGDLGCGGELSVWSDSDGFAVNFFHASFNLALVGVELDVLCPERTVPVAARHVESDGAGTGCTAAGILPVFRIAGCGI